MVNPIALAIPGFFVLISLEFGVGLLLGRQQGPRPLYRWVDSLTDLGCGVVSQVTGIALMMGGTAVAYTAAWNHLRMIDLPDGAALWIGTFIAVDFLYYWWHRASHRVSLLWAAHVVHHQSEDYNLAVALRQSVFTAVTILPFYLPLALLGVPPLVFLTCQALNTLYQFWIHTRLVGQIGPLELVLNTASHHRVHHGINPACIDRNHAGVFIVWDRLFGTFTPERAATLQGAEPVYGTVTPFTSADPLYANIEPVWSLLVRAAGLRGTDRLRVLFAPPEWRPGGVAPIPEPSPVLRWQPQTVPWQSAWTAAWFVVAAVTLTAVLLELESLPTPTVAVIGGLVVWTMGSIGWLYDGRRGWAWQEAARVLAAAAVAARWSGWV